MSSIPNALHDLTARFGQCPGTDRFLIEREAMYEWMIELGETSDRVHVASIGHSTDGRDLLLIAVSSPETIADLDAVRERRHALEDRGSLEDPANASGRLAGDKPVVLITAGIHASEVGGVQLMPELITWLATSPDERVARILERQLVLLVPTLNPDGMDLVHEWYEETLGTSAEGTSPPALYHRYAGHDNNRDWYTHTLAETRVVIDHVHRPWRPTIVLDLHQMGEHAPRYVLPPYIDPAEPHVHPLMTSLAGSLGTHLATAHHRLGHRGVASGVLFDGYSPTRAYQHYHGGVRILAEAASARIASPAQVDAEQFTVRRGFDPRVAGVHNPLPWHGGEWRLRDIMDYHLTTIGALLDYVAGHADDWIRDQWSMLADEVTRSQGFYVIAPLKQQIDPRAASDLVDILRRGDVEVDLVTKGNASVQRGSIVANSAQPFGSYARALLDLTPYPEMPTTPYDVTSHCLPVHMGVEVDRYGTDPGVEKRPLTDADLLVFAAPTAHDTDRSHWLAIDPRSHASVRVIAHAIRNGADVRRLVSPHFAGGRLLQPGTWLIAGEHALEGMSRAYRENIRTWLIGPVNQSTAPQRMPKIGLYVPWMHNAIDTGWLRLVLEDLAIPYSAVHDQDVRDGALDDLDALLFAHQAPEDLANGNSADAYPQEYAGGPGTSGIDSIREFASRGGHVIALDGAARALADPLGVRVRFPLASLTGDMYACPGTVVRVRPEGTHPLMLGIDEPFPVMLEGKNAFGAKVAGATMNFPARFDTGNVVVSGWMRGEKHLEGLGAMIDEPVGAGRFIGFAFRPHFRSQMLASYQPLINAIMRPGQEPETGLAINE